MGLTSSAGLVVLLLLELVAGGLLGLGGGLGEGVVLLVRDPIRLELRRALTIEPGS